MRSSTILSLGALSLAQAQFTPAPVITDNTPGKAYAATLNPGKDAKYPIAGVVGVVASKDGKGVDYTIEVAGFDPSLGPFGYHIHDFPVAEDGNCTSTGAHMDPTVRGEDPKCDPEKPEECQVGDLSGKYGKIKGAAYAMNYHDAWTSTNERQPAFVGNRSVTFHLPDKTRIACANFKLIKKGGDDSASSTGYIPRPSGGSAPYPIGTAGTPCPSGTAASTGLPAPSGTGAGPYPTGGAPIPPSAAPPSGGEGGATGAVPPVPSASSVVPGAGETGTGEETAVPTAGASGFKASVAGAAIVAGFVALFI